MRDIRVEQVRRRRGDQRVAATRRPARSGTGLVLGILHIWSVLKAGIPVSWGWSHADMALPYSVMCLAIAPASLGMGVE
jgi:hypothetical protein